MSLEYDVSLAGDRATVALSGRIDRDAMDALGAAYRAVSAASARSVVLDFTDVDYINSTGIALIVGLLGTARADGCAVLAAGLTAHYRHIFDITRLSDFITVVDSGIADQSSAARESSAAGDSSTAHDSVDSRRFL